LGLAAEGWAFGLWRETFMQHGQCPKCGSSDVIPEVYLLDRGHGDRQYNLQAIVEENPDAWLFKGTVRSSLKAWVCGACGYTELYANNPAALLAAHRKQLEPS
jgi:ribosomal protein S27AE